jgi:isopenicillin-N epimerase
VLPGDETFDSKSAFALDPALAYLNHGSFGARMHVVAAAQAEVRARLERNPMQLFVRDLEGLLDASRAAVADLVHARPEDLVFVPNASTAVSAVLRSMSIAAGDELLTTDHEYGACKNALAYVAERAGARVVFADVPFPLRDPDAVVEAVLAAVTPRTRLALVDHVTSPTGLVFPVAKIVKALAERGVETLIDGAHALGMIDVDLEAIGAAYWTANAHKWLCAPIGTAVLHVRRDLQTSVRPTTISHGAASTRTDRSRFMQEFDWPGTIDPSGAIVVPQCIAALEGLWPGGFSALRERNRLLALRGRAALASALGVEVPAPESMIGALASLLLPHGESRGASALDRDPLQEALAARGIEVPVVPWPKTGRRILRISAQAYVRFTDVERLVGALRELGACAT